jgi:hypothetical protein
MRKRFDWLLVAMLAVSVCGNVYFAGRLSASSSQPPQPTLTAIGDTVPLVDGLRVDGTRAKVDFQDLRPTLIYYFSPTCIWCDKNAAQVKHLIEQVGDRYKVIAVAATRVTAEEATEKGLKPELVISQVPVSTLKKAHLAVTPMTLLVAPGGEVSGVWSGAFTKSTVSEILGTTQKPSL